MRITRTLRILLATTGLAGLAATTAFAAPGNGNGNQGGIGTLKFVPAGAIIMYGGDAPPSGWLVCDGSEASRTENAALFAVIGTTYGEGDGSTTFNLPDLRQRFPMGLADAGTGSTLAESGGQIDHAHAVSASTGAAGDHAHDVAGTTASAGAHSHDVSGTTASAGDHAHGVTGTTASAGDHAHSVSGSTSSDGSHVHAVDGTTNPGGSHVHSMSGSTSFAGDHDHYYLERGPVFTGAGPESWFKDARGKEFLLGAAGGVTENTHVGSGRTVDAVHAVRGAAGDRYFTGSAGAHAHGFTGTTGVEGGHAHVFVTSSDPAGVHAHSFGATSGTAGAHGHPFVATSATAGAHGHAFSATSTTASAHGHAFSATSTSNGSHAHAVDATTDALNPPYLVLNFIIKE